MLHRVQKVLTMELGQPSSVKKLEDGSPRRQRVESPLSRHNRPGGQVVHGSPRSHNAAFSSPHPREINSPKAKWLSPQMAQSLGHDLSHTVKGRDTARGREPESAAETADNAEAEGGGRSVSPLVLRRKGEYNDAKVQAAKEYQLRTSPRDRAPVHVTSQQARASDSTEPDGGTSKANRRQQWKMERQAKNTEGTAEGSGPAADKLGSDAESESESESATESEEDEYDEHPYSEEDGLDAGMFQTGWGWGGGGSWFTNQPNTKTHYE